MTAHDPLAGALWAASRGWKVHPLKGKVATTPWSESATDDVEQIAAWLAGTDLNYGIACGPSGLLVIDDDEQGNAFAEYADSIGAELPETLTVATGRGLHYYFTHAGSRIGNATRVLGRKIDVRATGGYVVGPGSVHHDTGAIYAASSLDCEIAQAPDWLVAALTERKASRNASAPTHVDFAAPAEPRGKIRAGQRHDALMRYAVRLRKRHLGEDEAVLLVRERWKDCEQPAGDRFTVEQAEAVARDIFARYQPDEPEPCDDEETPGLALVRADQITPRETEWLTPNHIPQGHPVVFIGPEGIGKGLWWSNLVGQLTTGDDPIEIIVIVAEDDPQETVAPRLVAAGADRSRVHFLVRDAETMTGVPVIPGENARVRDLIDQTGARLVIIDPWMSVVPGNLQLRDTQQARQALDPVTRLARNTGAAFLLVAHTNRTGGNESRDRYGATVALRQVPRVCLMALPDPQDDSILYVGVDKSNLGPVPHATRYCKSGTGSYWRLEDTRDPVGLTIQELLGILARDADGRTSDRWTVVAMTAAQNGGVITRGQIVEAYSESSDPAATADKAIARWRNSNPPRLRAVAGKRGVFEVVSEPPASTPHDPHVSDMGGSGGYLAEPPEPPVVPTWGKRGGEAGGSDSGGAA